MKKWHVCGEILDPESEWDDDYISIDYLCDSPELIDAIHEAEAAGVVNIDKVFLSSTTFVD